MKTFTFAICILFSALVSYATVPKYGYTSRIDQIDAASGDHISAADEAFSVCLEAEVANGTGPVSDDPNASNGKTRGERDNWDYYVDYQPSSTPAGKYQLTLRYYAESNSTVNVSVNDGSIFAVNLPASHSWNIVWAEQTIEVTLNEGSNKIRIQEQYGYNVRQDKICLTKVGEPLPCDFKVIPHVVEPYPIYRPGETMTFNAKCTGTACNTTTYRWGGNGVSAPGQSITVAAPTALGDYYYTLTTSREGCADTTATLQIRVQSTPAACDYIVGTIVSDYTPSCGQGVAVSADCFGTGCNGLSYTWNGPGANIFGTSSINFNAPSQNGTYTYSMTSWKEGCPDRVQEFQLTVSGCGDEPFNACVEAENSNGNGPITEDPNASNGKTRGAENNWNHYVEYAVNGVQNAGPYELTLRYYAAGDGAVDIIVNGGELVPVVGLPSTHSWNIVSGERTVTVHLAQGNNIIRVVGLPGYSPVRQDKICITPSNWTGTPPACDYTVSAKAVIISPSCHDAVAIYAFCLGPDCELVNYRWTGNGIDAEGSIVYLPPPGKNGTFAYTLTATKNLCAPKTSTVEFTTTGCETSEPYSACVEAERSDSNGPVSDDPNASDGKTRGTENNYDYYVDYAFKEVPAAGYYSVKLRYYAAENAQVRITVNGVLMIPSLPLPATHSWNIVWREETFSIPLFEGNNAVRIQGLPGAACRQDQFCVLPTNSNARMAAPESLSLQNDNPQLQAYPNPASGEFEAVFSLEAGKTGTIQVSDIQGKVWHERQVKGKGSHKERITLGNAPSGIYLLQVKKPGSIETKKILFSH
jgi:hypothetical protein